MAAAAAESEEEAGRTSRDTSTAGTRAPGAGGQSRGTGAAVAAGALHMRSSWLLLKCRKVGWRVRCTVFSVSSNEVSCRRGPLVAMYSINNKYCVGSSDRTRALYAYGVCALSITSSTPAPTSQRTSSVLIDVTHIPVRRCIGYSVYFPRNFTFDYIPVSNPLHPKTVPTTEYIND